MKRDNGNKMGNMNMKGLVYKMAIPLMISMLVQALYNIVDSLFVSHIVDTGGIINAGDKAVAALTMAFPIQMLMTACNTGTGVGVNAVLSQFLGRGDRKSASRVAGNAMFLAICMFVVFMAFGIFGVKAFFESQTNDSVTLNFGISYLKICTICSFGTMGFFAFEKILQATGKTTLAMIAQLSGSVVNIILDPIFIFGYFGVPAMGVKGAAVATVIAQCVSFAVGGFVHFKFNREIDGGLKYLKPNLKIIGKIYKVGIPAIVMQSLTSVMAYGMNIILGMVSASAVTAFGIYYKLQNFIFMPAFGLNNALIPIVGFNYGSRNKKRIFDALKWGIIDVEIIMIVGIVVIQCFSAYIVGIFAVSDEVQKISIFALRIISLGYLFSGCNIILQGYCQALGNGVYSLVISLLRMAVVVLPLAYLIVTLGNESIVWIAFPVAELTALCVAVVMTIKISRERVDAI